MPKFFQNMKKTTRSLTNLWIRPLIVSSVMLACTVSLHAEVRVDASNIPLAEGEVGEAKAKSTPTPAATKLPPEFLPIEDQPGLPRVLLIGDSVSVAYTLDVRRDLEGVANLHRIPANGGSTKTALGSYGLNRWLKEGEKWDIIHFNFGLHDASYRFANDLDKDAAGNYASPTNGGRPNVSVEQYEKNLREIIPILRKTGAKLIFATTTPIPDSKAEKYVQGSEVGYNDVARKVMQEENIPINDLWTLAMPQLTSKNSSGEPFQTPRNVHFGKWSSAILGKQVAESIKQNL
jgi:acyl-CoA thioesterase-1